MEVVSSGSLRACRGKRHPNGRCDGTEALSGMVDRRPDFGSLACLLARLGGACSNAGLWIRGSLEGSKCWIWVAQSGLWREK
jgi:hypothetical protein